MFALKTFNLSTFFGAAKQTNFLDFTISAFDGFVLILLGIFIWKQLQQRGVQRSWLLWFFTATVLVGLAQIRLWQGNIEWVWVWKLVIISARLWVTVATAQLVFVTNAMNKMWKYFFFASLFFALFFDKFLLYNPQPAFFVGIIGVLILTLNQIQTRYKSVIYLLLAGYFALCFITQLWQITTSHSLGLNWLGESVLSLDTLGVAREKIGNWMFLRGYGLAEHASSMGFIGEMGMVFSSMLVKQNEDKLQQRTFFILTTLVAILSLSRSVLFLLFVFAAVYIFTRIKKSFTVQIAFTLGCILILSALIWQSVNLREQSNEMRMDELSIYTSAFEKMNTSEKIFGIGLGQYPYFLRSHFPDEEIKYWQAYPVHNTFLNVAIDIGILPLLIMIGTAFWIVDKSSHSSQHSKIIRDASTSTEI